MAKPAYHRTLAPSIQRTRVGTAAEATRLARDSSRRIERRLRTTKFPQQRRFVGTVERVPVGCVRLGSAGRKECKKSRGRKKLHEFNELLATAGRDRIDSWPAIADHLCPRREAHAVQKTEQKNECSNGPRLHSR